MINQNNQVYLITLRINTGNILQMCRDLFETGIFEFVESSFLREIKPFNAYNSNQWGLKNTGQYGGTPGIDIKAEQAWRITRGDSSIRVAVIDVGIDLTHPDLQANLLIGFDAAVSPPGGANGSPYANDAHGTACAGIIGAINNTVGTVGVAFGSKIIPVRIGYNGSGTGWVSNDTWIVNGIHHAWATANADVLSNSWGGGSPSNAITAEINDAIANGRNGNGCVVIFASGNNNTTVAYPANLPNVIAVSAMSQCGTRKRSSSNWMEVNPGVQIDPTGVSCDNEKWWGSNYGDALDVVAPGVKIYTTDIQGSAGNNTSSGNNGNYYADFNGTSAACPHVAAIAALILSVRLDLTQAQVRQAIESTCTKLTSYAYSANSNHPNDTWNSEVGHGLVNVYEAVKKVAFLLAGPSYFCSTGAFQVTNLPPGATVSAVRFSPERTTVSQSGANITISNPGRSGYEGWVMADVSVAGRTIPTDTMFFISGDYMPWEVEKSYSNSSCDGDNISDNWCYNVNPEISCDNRFRLLFPGTTHPKHQLILSSLQYKMRLVRQSNNQIVYTHTFGALDEIGICFSAPASPSIWYDKPAGNVETPILFVTFGQFCGGRFSADSH